MKKKINVWIRNPHNRNPAKAIFLVCFREQQYDSKTRVTVVKVVFSVHLSFSHTYTHTHGMRKTTVMLRLDAKLPGVRDFRLNLHNVPTKQGLKELYIASYSEKQ